jgi:hypothetical protein
MIKQSVFWAISMIVFSVSYISDPSTFSPINILVYTSALIIIIIIIYNVKSGIVKTYQIFGITYFSALLLNQLNISMLQNSKSLEFAVVVIFGGISTLLSLYFIDRKSELSSFDQNDIKIQKINILYYGMLTIYIISKIYIIEVHGLRIQEFIYGKNPGGDSFVVADITGISNILQWLLLVFVPYVTINKKITIFVVISIVAIVFVKRGDIARLIIFFIIYYISTKKTDQYPVRTITYIIISVLLFGFLGDIRQNATDYHFNITDLVQSRIHNSTTSWIIAYYSMNFEVLNLYLDHMPNQIGYISLFQPLTNFTSGGGAIISNYESEIWWIRISGFNASTYMSNFLYDFGKFWFIGLFFFNVGLYTIGLVIVRFKLFGAYILFLTFIALLVFSNYFIVPQILYALIAAILMNLFILRNN